LITAGLTLLIPFWLVGAWYQPGVIMLPIFVVMVVFYAGPLVACGVWFGTVRCLSVVAYMTVTFRGRRTEGSYQRFNRRAWAAAADFTFWKEYWWTPLVPVVGAIGWPLGFWGVAPLAGAFALGILVTALALLILPFALLGTLWNSRVSLWRAVTDARKWAGWLPAIGFLAAMSLFLWLANRFGEVMARIAVTIAGIGLVIFVLWTMFQLFKWLRYLASSPFPPGSFTREEWLKLLEPRSAGDQEEILLRTTHESLSLTPSGFLDVLNSAGSMIKGEPALSTYWRRRAELEQVLRQERRG
jgi:hypothetical protein